MLIQVTEEHIKNGEKGSCSACPIALAIQEATGLDCTVGGPSLTLYFPLGMYKQIALPDECTLFIINYDSGIAEEPFSFELNYEGDSNVHSSDSSQNQS